MINYHPTPQPVTGRKGLRAALGAMMIAAVVGTAAFDPVGAHAAASAGTTASAVVVATMAVAERSITGREGAGGSAG